MTKSITKDLQIELLKKDVSFKDKEIDKLEERIDKAIEYINDTDLGTLDKWKLQEILKGESNE